MAQTDGLPTLEIKIDREAAKRYGLSISEIFGVIGKAIGGEKTGTLFEGDRRFDIFVRLPESCQEGSDCFG